MVVALVFKLAIDSFCDIVYKRHALLSVVL